MQRVGGSQRRTIVGPERLEQRLMLTEWLGFEEIPDLLGPPGESFGLAWGDANGDPYPDLWQTNHTDPSTLYLGDGAGGFDLAAWQPSAERDKHGAIFADLNADGDEDVVELVGGDGANLIYYNQNGDGFQLDSTTPLTYPPGRGRTPLVVDANRDGLLDVVMANVGSSGSAGPPAIFMQDSAGAFSIASPEFDLGLDSAQFAQLADVTGDGTAELVVFGSPVTAYQLGAQGLIPLTHVDLAELTQGDATIADFNGDGWNDLISLDYRLREHEQAVLANGRLQIAASLNHGSITREVVFSSTSDQITVEIGPDAVLDLAPGEPLVAGDGVMIEGAESVIRRGTPPGARGFRRFHVTAQPIAAGPVVGVGIVVSRNGDGLWQIKIDRDPNQDPVMNRINMTVWGDDLSVESSSGFTDAPFHSQVYWGGPDGFMRGDPLPTIGPGQCESLAAGDFDNDGDIDLYVACSGAAVNSDNALLLNSGQGQFAIATSAAGAVGNVAGRAKSVATADIDLDGHLDIVVSNGGGGAVNNIGPTLLMHNKGSANHWLQIDLDGWTGNVNAIGAIVSVTTGEKVQSRTVGGNVHRYAADHRRLHFGLGEHASVDSIAVHWPDGTLTEYDGPIAADRLVTIRPPEVAIFAAAKPDGQVELFSTNGTTHGTSLLRNLGGATSTDPRELTVVDFRDVGERLLFAARGGDGQTELAISDGTLSGTHRLRGLGGTLSSDPHELTSVDLAGQGPALMFAATRFNGQIELFISDGTKSGTGIVKDLGGSQSADPRELVGMDGALYFSAVGPDGQRELYRSDGTFDGTLMVSDLAGGISSDPRDLTAAYFEGLGHRLFFSALGVDGQRELHLSDGTTEGTRRVRNLSGSISAEPSELTVMNGKVYFVATMDASGQRELYASDGTFAGTSRVKNLSQDISSDPHGLVVASLHGIGTRLFFAATGNDGEVELVMSDGTFAGTTRLKDIGATTSSHPAEFTEYAGRLYFVATRANGQRELHQTDGTTTGTGLVTNLSGQVSANPRGLAVAALQGLGETLLFAATDAERQVELFVSDGTAAGTSWIGDLASEGGSHPAQITAFGGSHPNILDHGKHQVVKNNAMVFLSASVPSPERSRPDRTAAIDQIFRRWDDEIVTGMESVVGKEVRTKRLRSESETFSFRGAALLTISGGTHWQARRGDASFPHARTPFPARSFGRCPGNSLREVVDISSESPCGSHVYHRD